MGASCGPLPSPSTKGTPHPQHKPLWPHLDLPTQLSNIQGQGVRRGLERLQPMGVGPCVRCGPLGSRLGPVRHATLTQPATTVVGRGWVGGLRGCYRSATATSDPSSQEIPLCDPGYLSTSDLRSTGGFFWCIQFRTQIFCSFFCAFPAISFVHFVFGHDEKLGVDAVIR